MALGFNIASMCPGCKLFLPAMDCPSCKSSWCQRCIVKHGKEHKTQPDHARLAAGGTDRQLFKLLGLA